MKRVLLVGGGHSHLAVLKSFADAPIEGVRFTLLSPNRHALYSGMIPGLIAGHYRLEDCRVDLVALAAHAGGRLLADSALGIDPGRREVTTRRGERLAYDLLSLDIGSAAGEAPGMSERALRLRPVELFLAGWERLREAARRGEVRRIAVIGGGAAGVEVLLAMQYALANAAVEFTLFDGTHILTGHSESVRRRIARILVAQGVGVRTGRKVFVATAGELEFEGGERIQAQATVWATGPSAPAWIAASGLRTDALGFVAVSEALQSVSHPEVFAAGDVATIVSEARPKSGAIAVRQGPALARNLRLALAGAALKPFRSPAWTLALISCGDCNAVASWGPLALGGAWVWRWKDRIDRRFVGKYRLGPGP